MSDFDEQKIEEAKRVIPKFGSFRPSVTAIATTTASEASNSTKDSSKRSKESHSEKRHSRRERDHRSRSRSRHHGSGRERQHERERDRKRDDGRREHRHRQGRDHSRDTKDRRKRHHERSSPDRSHRRGDARETNEYHRSSKRPESPVKAALPIVHINSRLSPSPPSSDPHYEKLQNYIIDTKGDEKNLVYGTIYKYSIPSYHRFGAGRILGLPKNLVIDREKSDDKSVALKAIGEGQSARSMRQSFASLHTAAAKRLRVKKSEPGLEEAFARNLEFVPFNIKSKKRKAQEDENSDQSADDGRDHYRSLEGMKRKLDRPEDPDLDYASDSDEEGDYIAVEDMEDRGRRVELARKVDAEPDNIDAWMAYVDYHDSPIGATGRRKTAAEKRSSAEIKLDILQKALAKNPGNEKLLLKHMDVAEELWDSQKLLSKWIRLLEENPSMLSLWTKYINFRQTDFLSFTYPECLKCFSECLSVLSKATFKKPIGSSEREALDRVILYVFLRFVLLMQDSGYKENAIATIQAMLELNLFCPPTVTAPMAIREHEALLESFERFWNSEVPRIGENDAQGWAAFVAAGENGYAPERVEDIYQIPQIDAHDPFGSWTDAEIKWSQRLGMPARTTDEVEDEDPLRVVLFSDFSDFLFYFATESVRKELVKVFLIFRALPLLESQCSNNDITKDIFLHNTLSQLNFNVLDPWFWPRKRTEGGPLAIVWEGMEPEMKPGIGDSPFEFKIDNCPLGRESTFSKSTPWFNAINRLHTDNPEEAKLIRNTLKMLLNKLNDESLALYYLAWEWGNAPKGIKKVAKALIKMFKTSLQLWSAYAQIEWHDTGREAGRKVFSMALGMSKEFSTDARQDAVLLWHAWVWQELYAKDTGKALSLILSIEDGMPTQGPSNLDPCVPISKSSLLRTRRYLEDQQHTMLSLHFHEYAAVYNDLYALLEYLAHGSKINIDPALAVYDEFMQELERRSLTGPNSRVYEICLLRKSRLIYWHSITAKPFKPATLRSTLETALENFPFNTVFLGLYSWNESRTRIANNLRTVIRNRVLKEGRETVIGWLFAIWAELRSGEHFSVHAVRALFEEATGSIRTQSNIQLWIAYVHFELRYGSHKRAKDVLYRGIAHCPWSKDLIMIAFTELRDVMGLEDLQKLLSIMASEKELRVHDVEELEDLVDEMFSKRPIFEQRRGAGLIDLPDDASTDEEMDD
ncbi:NRDE-2, necessary for RNA interference-domain-containing protein [Pyronema omphalodes]|nr:NRDE-2, necessary for RNA interference-domain-containing protein [Pyronema omphalodes]